MKNPFRPMARRVRSLRYAWKPFYRRCGLQWPGHPVHASANVPTIDSRIIVSHQYRYLFVRVPKCANTTILSSLWMCEQGMATRDLENLDEIERKSMLRKQNMKRQFIAPSRLGSGEVDAVFEQYTKAIIVRNPFTRLASAYLYAIKDNDRAYRYGLKPTISFAGFCDYLCDGGLHADIHWMPQSHICPLKPEQLDFIGHMETLSDDLGELVKRIYSCTPHILSRQHHSTGAANQLAELYSERERMLVAEVIYPDDFAFGYSADKLG